MLEREGLHIEHRCLGERPGEPHLVARNPPQGEVHHRRVERVLESRAWEEALEAQAKRPLAIDYELLQERFPWPRMPPGSPPDPVAELLGYDPLAPA